MRSVLPRRLVAIIGICFGLIAFAHAGTIESVANTNNLVKYFEFSSQADASSNPTFVIQQTYASVSKVLFYVPETSTQEPQWVMANLATNETTILRFTALDPSWTSCELKTTTPTTWMDPSRMNFEHKASGTIYFICTPKGSSPKLFTTSLNLANPTDVAIVQLGVGLLANPAKVLVADDWVYTFNDGGSLLYQFRHGASAQFSATTLSASLHHLWRCGSRVYASTNFSGAGTITECTFDAGSSDCVEQSPFGAPILWISDMSPPCGTSKSCFIVGYLHTVNEKILYQFLPGAVTQTTHQPAADFDEVSAQNYIPLTGLIGQHSSENRIVFSKAYWITTLLCDNTTSASMITNTLFTSPTNRIHVRFPGYTLVSDGTQVYGTDDAAATKFLGTGTLIPTLNQNSTDTAYGVAPDTLFKLPKLFTISGLPSLQQRTSALFSIRHTTINRFQMIDAGLYKMEGSSGLCFFLAAGLGLSGVEPAYSCDSLTTASQLGNFNTRREAITTLLDSSSRPMFSPPTVESNPKDTTFDFVINFNPQGGLLEQIVGRVLQIDGGTFETRLIKAPRDDPTLGYGAAYANQTLLVRDNTYMYYSLSLDADLQSFLMGFSPAYNKNSVLIFCNQRFFYTIQPNGVLYTSSYFLSTDNWDSINNFASAETPQFQCINDRYIVARGTSSAHPSAIIAWSGRNATAYAVVATSSSCKFEIYEYIPETSQLLYGCKPGNDSSATYFGALNLLSSDVPFGTPMNFTTGDPSKQSRFLAATSDLVFLHAMSGDQSILRVRSRIGSATSVDTNCLGTPIGIPRVGVVFLHTNGRLIFWTNSGSRTVVEPTQNYTLTQNFVASGDVLVLQVQHQNSGKTRSYVANVTTASGPVDESLVFDFELLNPGTTYNINGRVGFMCATSAHPGELCFIESLPPPPGASGEVVLPTFTNGDLNLNQSLTFILPPNSVVNGSVVVDNTATLQLSGGTTVSGDVVSNPGSTLEIVGIAVISGSLSTGGTVLVNSNSSLSIGSNFTLGSGTLTFTTPLFSSVSSTGCVDTTNGHIQIDLSQVSGSGETLLLSGSSQCSAFPTPSQVSYLNSNPGVCARTETRPGNGVTQLFLVYNDAPESGGCNGAPSSAVDIPVVVGAVVGSVVGTAVLIVAILMLVPKTRKKILPYENRGR